MPRAAPKHNTRPQPPKTHAAPTHDNRPSAARRGYDRHWRKLRQAKLSIDPLCEHCLAKNTVEPAVEVDHILPVDTNPELRLDMENLQSLCVPCHRRKTAGTQRRGQARPEWLPEPEIPVTLVCGPPCSGKSTYARTHAGRRDEVLDLDAIAEELSGQKGHGWSRPKWLGPALHERNRRLAHWAENTPHRGGWLIVSAPTLEERDWWRAKLNARVVVLETDATECAARAEQDGRLGDRMRYLIGQWWERYTPCAREEKVKRGGAASIPGS